MNPDGHIKVRDVASTVHIARQRIVHGDGTLYGYELLFRDTAHATVATSRDDLATASTIVAAFSEFDANALLGGRYGFVNITPLFIRGAMPLPFEPDDVVLEIPGAVLADPMAPTWVSRLVNDEYQVAVDDFRWTDRAEEILDLVDFVKVDMLSTAWEEVAETVARCRHFHGRLIAKRVETADVASRCAEVGFTLYQGHYFRHPETLSIDTLTISRSLALEIVSRLRDPDITMADLEHAIAGDAALYYRLLRIANSVSRSSSPPLRSIRDVLERIGKHRLQAWVTLLALTSDSEPNAELALALVRASTCERVARRLGSTPDTAFVTGLLDGIADALRLTGEELLTRLPHVTDEISDALRGGSGPLRDILSLVHAYENADLSRIPFHGPAFAHLSEEYLQALTWTARTTTPLYARAG